MEIFLIIVSVVIVFTLVVKTGTALTFKLMTTYHSHYKGYEVRVRKNDLIDAVAVSTGPFVKKFIVVTSAMADNKRFLKACLEHEYGHCENGHTNILNALRYAASLNYKLDNEAVADSYVEDKMAIIEILSNYIDYSYDDNSSIDHNMNAMRRQLYTERSLIYRLQSR